MLFLKLGTNLTNVVMLALALLLSACNGGGGGGGGSNGSGTSPEVVVFRVSDGGT